MHKILVRNDLNMRRGKMAAQSSHALMKAMLDCFESRHDGHSLYLDEAARRQLKHWQSEPTVSVALTDNLDTLSSAEEQHAGTILRVDDLGRTEFHGVKTTTCSCLVDPAWQLSASPRIPKPFNEPLQTKQVIAVRRDIKLSKEQLCEYAAIASVDALLHGLDLSGDWSEFDLNTQAPLAVWLRTAFGKIVVGVPDLETLVGVTKSAYEEDCTVGMALGQNQEMIAVAIGPDFPEQVDKLTGSFKLL